jgi:hypothetical protein
VRGRDEVSKTALLILAMAGLGAVFLVIFRALAR